ncbi:GDNF family receptor alpha-2-like [Mastacembelus armatus]|uniref:GDNF family receptor alpha-2-like n=1 Tax=Mastacembelus armatus TaxID=205130 RepID=UPI000E4627B7|nr:GDNF family receptor alpha-2-like [Mastacembelus armatus]
MKSAIVWMCVHIFLLLLDEAAGSWDGSSALSASLATSAPETPGNGSVPRTHSGWVDCIQASDMCNQNTYCSSRYRVMRQCLVGKEKEAMLDHNRECQAAIEVLLDSPLYDCRCKRGMKKELQCLQNYWTIHMGLTEGGDMDDSSPYEPLAPHHDAFRLASISSGMLTVAPKGFQCPDAEKNCNPCLDAAKACNINSSCKRQRSAYIATCSKGDPNKGETCSKKRCHKALRLFLDRVPTEFSHQLLFCPCQTEGCAERRRQTIVPDCSYNDKDDKKKPNCLELQRACQQDALCRSRLADYMKNCDMTHPTVSTCNQDNHQACLASYTGLIGTDMTPNYVDHSVSNWTISPWCTCKGSGNQDEECVSFLRSFIDNTCLRNAIQAFGYGIDNVQKKNISVPAPSSMTTMRSDLSSEPTFTMPKYNEPMGRGLDNTLQGDHSGSVCASVWALLLGLVLALALAQHVL